MFQHLLVPLDGSTLAEAALPVAATLARRLDAAVTLIHIIEKNAPTDIHGERHLKNEAEACDYLSTAAEAFAVETKVSRHVHAEEVRDVARAIVCHADELTHDLIVMCTHGKSGLLDRMAGTIAQQVVGQGDLPVLLVPIPAGTFNPSRLLVALDGDPEHEHGLDVAGELALAFGAALDLLTVVPNMENLTGRRAATGRLLPGATMAMLAFAETPANEYLETVAAPWRARGVQVNTQVRRGDPAQEILAAAKAANDGLLVLGTHGHSGMQAFWAGSVAPRVTAASHLPVLFVPVHA